MYKGILTEIKNRLGRRTFDPRTLKVLIRRGLVAGDYGRAYLTDKGQDFLEKLVSRPVKTCRVN
jgi:hypothetical protein